MVSLSNHEGARRFGHFRSNFITQLSSQFLPPSADIDCSQRGLAPPVQSKRTRTGWPPSMSSPKNSPRPFSNRPMVGGNSLWLLVSDQ